LWQISNIWMTWEFHCNDLFYQSKINLLITFFYKSHKCEEYIFIMIIILLCVKYNCSCASIFLNDYTRLLFFFFFFGTRNGWRASVKPGLKFTSVELAIRLLDNGAKGGHPVPSVCLEYEYGKEWIWRRGSGEPGRLQSSGLSSGFRRTTEQNRDYGPRNPSGKLRGRLIVFRTICGRLHAHVGCIQRVPVKFITSIIWRNGASPRRQDKWCVGFSKLFFDTLVMTRPTSRWQLSNCVALRCNGRVGRRAKRR